LFQITNFKSEAVKKLVVLSGLFLWLSYTAFSQCSNPDAGYNTEVCGSTVNLSVANATEDQYFQSTDDVLVNIDFQNGITVSLYQQITGKSNNSAYVLISEQQPGSNGQVIFQNLEPGNYFLSSLLSHPESYPYLIENVYFNNSPVIDDAAAFIISDGSVFPPIFI
jgi:hypothetical protein